MKSFTELQRYLYQGKQKKYTEILKNRELMIGAQTFIGYNLRNNPSNRSSVNMTNSFTKVSNMKNKRYLASWEKKLSAEKQCNKTSS